MGANPLRTKDPMWAKWAEEGELNVQALRKRLARQEQVTTTIQASTVDLPDNPTGVSASESGYIIDGVLYSEVTCTYTAPNPIGTFTGIFLVAKNYRGSSELVKIAEHAFAGAAGGSVSFKVTLQRTNETVTLYFVGKNSLEEAAESDWALSPSTTILLDGNASAPNAPTGVAASQQQLGISLTWNENSETNLQAYNVYRFSTNTPASATIVGSVAATTLGKASYFDKIAQAGTTYFYWITAVNSAFQESAKSSSVTASSGPVDQLPVQDSIVHTGTSPGGGNNFDYRQFSTVNYSVVSGDQVEFDVFIDPTSPAYVYSLDFQYGGGINFRSSGLVDQNGLSAHPNTDLTSYARGRWYHRVFVLTPIAGNTITSWASAHEGDPAGTYLGRLANVVVTNAGTLKAVIFSTAQLQGSMFNLPVWAGGASNYTNVKTFTHLLASGAVSLDDQVLDGATYIRTTATQINNSMDASGNLKLKVVGGVNGSTNGPSTTSATFVVLPEMTMSVTAHGNKVFVGFTGVFQSINSFCYWAIFRDGTQLSPTLDFDDIVGGSFMNGSFTLIDQPSSGPHTYDVRWHTDAGHTVFAIGTARTLQVVELA